MKHRHNWQFLRYAMASGRYWIVEQCQCGLLRYISGMGQYKTIRFLKPGKGLMGGKDIKIGLERVISLRQEAESGYLAQRGQE